MAKKKTDKNRMRKRRFEVQSNYQTGRIYIDDDDFHWDALLRVNGDFENDAEKLRYAKAIARVLSKYEDEIPYRPVQRRGAEPTK